MVKLCISIVSHKQIGLVNRLLTDLSDFKLENTLIKVVHNVPETKLNTRAFPKLAIEVIENNKPLGFAANHNQVLLHTDADYLCVLNPDIRFEVNPFPALLATLHDSDIAAVSPLIIDKTGKVQDSARKFPKPAQIFRRVILRQRCNDYCIEKEIIYPDWIAGMFMLFRREPYQQLKGFDERYYLYCEDADICYRLRQKGYKIALNTQTHAIHEAQRSSHNNIKYLLWHIKSLLILWCMKPKA
jgi:N-acetylglucosaminyl-diphospho-decaprenol L-rhamnosyltransferase